MKTVVTGILLIAGLLVGPEVSSQPVFSNKDLSISKLDKNMWVVETTDNTTMYIIEGTQKAMLIDAGTHCEKLDSVVRLITKKPLFVVITHAHGDHDGNIGFFPEIYLHPADTVLMDKSYKGKIHFVKDGQIFDLGGTQIEVAWMPGHTPGSIVLIDRAAGNCYSGDAFGSGQVWMQLRPYSPMATYQASCRKMEKLMDEGISRIYCGHYPYVKKAFDKNYIVCMDKLAGKLISGTVKDAEEYPIKVEIGGDKPMIATEGEASIVYDPDHLF